MAQHELNPPATPKRRPWVLWPGLLVAVSAVAATAHGLTEVALGSKVPEQLAWLYPVITDGLALVAYASTARLVDRARSYAWVVVVVAAGLSGLAQAAYLAGGVTSAPVGLRWGVGAWPAVAAAVIAHLLFLIDAEHRRRVAASADAARAAEEKRQDEAAALERAEALRLEREERRAERAAAGTGASTRRRTRPAKPSIATPAKAVPAAGTAPSTGASTDTREPVPAAGTGRLHVIAGGGTAPSTHASTRGSDAGQWGTDRWRDGVAMAIQYRAENGTDPRVTEFQALGMGRNPAAELRRAVLDSSEYQTASSTRPAPDASTGTDPTRAT